MKYLKKLIIDNNKFDDFCKQNKNIEIEIMEIDKIEYIDPFLEENKNFIIDSKIQDVSFRVLLLNEIKNFLSKEEIKKLEDIISKNSYDSYRYANDIIKGPWLKGEEVISKDSYISYRYALDIIKGPWPKGENSISTHLEWSRYYIKYVIKGPWPKGEEIISKDPESSCEYAINIIKGRWEKGEEAINESPKWSKKYYSFLNKNNMF